MMLLTLLLSVTETYLFVIELEPIDFQISTMKNLFGFERAREREKVVSCRKIFMYQVEQVIVMRLLLRFV